MERLKLRVEVRRQTITGNVLRPCVRVNGARVLLGVCVFSVD